MVVGNRSGFCGSTVTFGWVRLAQVSVIRLCGSSRQIQGGRGLRCHRKHSFRSIVHLGRQKPQNAHPATRGGRFMDATKDLLIGFEGPVRIGDHGDATGLGRVARSE